MSVWGKRTNSLADETPSGIHNDKRKWGDNSMSVWGKRVNFHEEKIPSEMNSDKRRWGDNSMSVWGKRASTQIDQITSEIDNVKRKWGDKSMSVWGKREIPSDIDKRKWGDNSMNVWGKRFDSDSSAEHEEDEKQKKSGLATFKHHEVDKDVAEMKRKWGDNTMQVWGKRSSADVTYRHSISKRSLSDNVQDYDGISDSDIWQSIRDRNLNRPNLRQVPKRNWETNTMRVWGKRGWSRRSSPTVWERSGWSTKDTYDPIWSTELTDPYDDGRDLNKRAWSSDNGLRVWG
jgi:hypothetical protein